MLFKGLSAETRDFLIPLSVTSFGNRKFQVYFLNNDNQLVKLNVNSPNSNKRIGSKRKTARILELDGTVIRNF